MLSLRDLSSVSASGERVYRFSGVLSYKDINSFFFFFFVFLGPLLWHMEVPRLGVESEL